jgi:hypothetical protein
MIMSFFMAKITVEWPEHWGSTPGRASQLLSGHDSGKLCDMAVGNEFHDPVPIEFKNMTNLYHSSRQLQLNM